MTVFRYGSLFLKNWLAYHPEQQQPLPSALQDWLPQGDLAYFISDTVDSLKLYGFHVRYAAGGPRNQPYHPAMKVKVLVCAYASGVFSSRKIAMRRAGGGFDDSYNAQTAIDKTEHIKARGTTKSVSGLLSHPMAGSRTCWGSGSSACEG